MSSWNQRFIKSEGSDPPRELVAPCWRMRGPSGQVLSCAIYRTDAGLEVRAGYTDDVLRTRRALDIEDGQRWADTFRREVLNQGGFEELPIRGNANKTSPDA